MSLVQIIILDIEVASRQNLGLFLRKLKIFFWIFQQAAENVFKQKRCKQEAVLEIR